ncbi:hypothetical protein PENTCL1PPCAC_12990, partial [Pristionchus entomophagus]
DLHVYPKRAELGIVIAKGVHSIVDLGFGGLTARSMAREDVRIDIDKSCIECVLDVPNPVHVDLSVALANSADEEFVSAVDQTVEGRTRKWRDRVESKGGRSESATHGEENQHRTSHSFCGVEYSLPSYRPACVTRHQTSDS